MFIYKVNGGQFVGSYQGHQKFDYLKQFGETYTHHEPLEYPEYYQYVDGKLERLSNWLELKEAAELAKVEASREYQRKVVQERMESALKFIDSSAEQQRAPFITQGDGQALSYQRKAEQALACLADPAPVIENYPWLKGDLVATGLTLQEVAQRVIDTRTGFDAIGALIEEIRLVAKDKVRTIAADEALSIDEKLSAMHQASEVDWSPIDALVASWNT